jgi:lysylphosphatidylglycerol synthetase-like protein (DUF2156 family)
MNFIYSFKKNNKKSLVAISFHSFLIFATLLVMFANINGFEYNSPNIFITAAASIILGFFLGFMLNNGFAYVYLSSLFLVFYGFIQVPKIISNPEITTPASFSIMSIFIFAVIGGLIGGLFEFFKYRMDKKRK